MTRDIDIPDTIGELVDLLKKYPANTKVDISISEIANNGCIDEYKSNKMQIQDDWPNDVIFITFGHGHYLP